MPVEYVDHRGGGNTVRTGTTEGERGGGGSTGWDDVESFFNRGHNEYRDVGSMDGFIDPRTGQAYGQRGELARQLGERGAPTAQNVGPEGQNSRQQSQLMDLLMQRAQGQGPSISDMQMQRGLDQGMAQQQALASTGRGNAALAGRQASQNASGMAQNMAGQAAMGRLAETQGAQQLAAGALQGARGQDQQYAQMTQQGNQFNVNAGLQQTQMNDMARQSMLQQQLQALQMAQGGREAYQDARTQRFMGLTQTPTTGEQLMGGAAAIGALISDRRAKTDIKEADKEASTLMKALRPYKYRYKDERNGAGEQFGIMAQDLEKAVPSAVIDTPKGKMVHGGRLAAALAAALPGLDKRLEKLEARSK